MCEPKTRKIKERLLAYTALLREIDNQQERLDRMESNMGVLPGPDMSGMPRPKGGVSDRVSVAVVRKVALEEKIAEVVAIEREENAALEELIGQLADPDERAVIRLKYFDRVEWPDIVFVLFGGHTDLNDRFESYQNRVYKIHGRALLNLADILEKANAAVKGSKGK